MQRAVVTPLIRSFRNPSRAIRVSSHSVLHARSSRCSGIVASIERWLWHSIMPGMRVVFFKSITFAPSTAGHSACGTISSIFPSRTITAMCSFKFRSSPTRTRSAFKIISLISVSPCFILSQPSWLLLRSSAVLHCQGHAFR